MKNKRQIIITSLIALLVVFVTVGVTYAFFTYSSTGTTVSTMTSGAITFHYKEVTGIGNGISISDALPISDTDGKASNKYFDFKITSKSNLAQVPYTVTATATGNVELGEIVKVYLTEVNGNSETELLLDNYSNLDNATFITNRNDKILYQDTVPMDNSNYEKNFRLRMWMDINTNLADGICSISTYTNQKACVSNGGEWNYKYNSKEFSIKVNVYTNEGRSLTEDNITTPDDTRVNMITANNTYLFANSSATGVDYEVSVPGEVTSAVINTTERNVLATSSVTPLGQTLSYVDSPIIRKISTSNSYNLLKGNNYFRVTVTAANGHDTKDYILKIVREEDRNNDLTYLAVDGYAFNEPFDKDTTTYTVSLEESSITILGNKASDTASISASDLGEKQLNWGNNSLTVTVTAEAGIPKVYTINVNNVRPTAPSITGGTNGVTSTEDQTISIVSPGTAVSGVAYYEYYKSSTNTAPTDSTEGIVLSSPYTLTVSENGTNYIWYRTVSNKGNKSAWTTDSEEVNLDKSSVPRSLSLEILSVNSPYGENPTLSQRAGAVGETGLYQVAVNGKGFGGTNNGGTTYVFRGNVSNNYINFAGQTWRIVRINEDGTIRLILNYGINNNAKIQYNSYYVSSYSQADIKTVNNNWYTTNIDKLIPNESNKKYSDYVESGNYFCQKQVLAIANGIPSQSVNLECENDLLNLDVGLITYDELNIAGFYPNLDVNENYSYLSSTKDFWSMTLGCTSYSTPWHVNPDGRLRNAPSQYDGKSSLLLRPVINLKSNVQVTGNGSSSSPYVVLYD